MLRVALSSSSTVISRALATVAASRILSEPIANSFRRSKHHLVDDRNIPNQIFCSNFSTISSDALKKVDRKLAKALKHEIRSVDPSTIKAPEAPSNFPFEIEDIPGNLMVELKREFEGEKIVVEVFDPIYPDDGSEDDDGDKKIPGETCCWYPNEARIQLNVNITKEDEEKLKIMLWGVVGYVGYPTMFYVNGVLFKDVEKLDFDWREIIRTRGVDDSMAEFMMEYMNRRSDRHRWLTLKKFRDFVKA